MKQPDFDRKSLNPNVEYSARDVYKLPGKSPKECLPQMFDAVFEKQLEPQFQKMLRERIFKPCHAFAHWDSGFNKFHLDIYGNFFGSDVEIEIKPGSLPQDAIHFSENMKAANEQLLKLIFNEMMKQNMTGLCALIVAQSEIGILEHSYEFIVVWKCYPQGTDEKDFINQADQRRKANLN